VLGPYRRRGVARALLARAEEEARIRRKRYLGLYVSGSNYAAQQLYLRAGFVNRVSAARCGPASFCISAHGCSCARILSEIATRAEYAHTIVLRTIGVYLLLELLTYWIPNFFRAMCMCPTRAAARGDAPRRGTQAH